MILSTTTAEMQPFVKTMAETLPLFKETGFKLFDLSFYHINQAGSPFTLAGDSWKREIYEVCETAAKLGYSFCTSHAPDINYFNISEEKKELAVLLIKRTIEACAMLSIPSTVLHSGWRADLSPAEFMRKNKDFNSLFFDDMEKYNVNILIENSCYINNPYYYLRTGAEMREYLEFVNHPKLFACWDTGHANMENDNQYKSLIALDDYLFSLHIADNYGNADSHTAPFCGTCNFDQVMQALMDINYKGTFNFEATKIIRNHESWPHFRKGWEYKGDSVTKLLNLPIHLKKQAINLCFEIGKYMLQQYNCYDEI